MRDVQVLDCTLRDGGRIIDCRFEDSVIFGIGRQLNKGKIDIIEMGFLRDHIEYHGNSTFFSCVSDANIYAKKICEDKGAADKCVLFMDYGWYTVDNLPEVEAEGITGIRYGFTKQDFKYHQEDLLREMRQIQDKGYDLYIQDVNTPGYSEMELLDVLEMVNDISPVSFGIVDTYGSMYLDDLEYLWHIVNRHLKKTIAVDFHSHNNMQMSFALAQRLIQLAGHERNLIVDATLSGMGKCAGNLNTELIVDFLTRKKDYDYDTDAILDAIDWYIRPVEMEEQWGYSIPAFLAGVFKAHPNNIIYLTEKYRLSNKDIKYIVSGIEEKKRQRYDYDNIQRVYKEYCSTIVEDEESLQRLNACLSRKSILILAPGSSVEKCKKKIRNYIKEMKPTVISVNFDPEDIQSDYWFYANPIHWEKVSYVLPRERCILSSNIHLDTEGVYLIGYSRLIEEDSVLGDNSTIMLLNLLKCIGGISNIVLAGFDGLSEDKENYVDSLYAVPNACLGVQETNREVARLFARYKSRVNDLFHIEFLTPSKYDE